MRTLIHIVGWTTVTVALLIGILTISFTIAIIYMP